VHRYTPRELRFLESKGAGRSLVELTELFNKRFGLSLNRTSISSVCVYYKMNFGRIHKYTAAEIRFLKGKVVGRSYAELTDLFNRRFGLSFTVTRLSGTLKRLNLSNGRDARFRPGQVPFNKGRKGVYAAGCEKGWFRPGQMPQTWQPVGTEVIDEYGYTKVKTRNPRTWKYKHRLIWEEAHGKVPRGHAVIFADGDKTNLVLKNLLLVSRAELAVMNHCGLISGHRDLTMVGKAVADIKLAIAGRKRGLKKARRRRKKKEIDP
jgi:hypothetical protein